MPFGQDNTEAQMAELKRIGRPVKNSSTHNKYLIRLQLEADALSKWKLNGSEPTGLIPYVKFSKLLGESNLFRKYMGLSGLVDLATLSDDELRRHMARTKTRENTWWLYFGNIPVDLIEEVTFKTSKGYVPYEFEAHGREEFNKVGLHMVSKSALDELQKICAPRNRFDIPQAAVYCATAKSQPTVAFQAGGAAWDIDLVTFTSNLRAGELPANIDAVVDWTKAHKEELNALWPAAVETYNRYYPADPASLPKSSL